jgi:hypothetical protein
MDFVGSYLAIDDDFVIERHGGRALAGKFAANRPAPLQANHRLCVE